MPSDKKRKTSNKNNTSAAGTVVSIILLLLTVYVTVSIAGAVRKDFERRKLAVSEIPAPTASAAVPEPSSEPETTPVPEPTPVPDPEYYTLSFVGDCTLSESKNKRGWGVSYQSVVGKDYSYPFKNTVEYFKDDYMTLANLECNLTDTWYDSIEWYNFLAPSAYAKILTEGCVDFVTTANNHVMDFGQNAYNDTIASLKAVNMPYAGENETYIYQKDDGLIVGVYCLYNSKMSNVSDSEAKIKAGYEKLKAQGAQLFVAALHWGVEGAYSVSETQLEVGHYAVDAGFNIVYGSHPHRLEPAEQYNDGVIFYSMANWSFGGHTNPADYDTAIAQVTVKLVGDEVSIESVNIIPCSISSKSHNHVGHSENDTCLNDYCPTPYEKDSDDWKRVMSKLDGTYEGADYIPNYQAILFG